MLRIMMSILAALATAVTILIRPEPDEWYQYLPALALVITMIVVWIAHIRHAKPSTPDDEDDETDPDERSLEQDGIVSIRPVPDQPHDSAIETKPESPPTPPPPPHKVAHVESHATTRFSVLPNPQEPRVLNAILEGFRVSIGAHAVGALRQISEDGQEFKVLGTAGTGWAKSRGDVFKCNVPLLPRSQRMIIRSVDATDLPFQIPRLLKQSRHAQTCSGDYSRSNLNRAAY